MLCKVEAKEKAPRLHFKSYQNVKGIAMLAIDDDEWRSPKKAAKLRLKIEIFRAEM